MIRALEPTPIVIETPPVSDEERATNLAVLAEFDKNVTWWNAHAEEIIAQHAGKFVCVAGQELFVGDDPAEVIARAQAAHPNPGRGFFTKHISTLQGPKIYANQRTLGSGRQCHLATDDLRGG
ncbi:MAG: hypothetical protein L0241_29085 [Planctomycetia bacterium]|nr:hypothetical protein [Planctomycetia bacterium]